MSEMFASMGGAKHYTSSLCCQDYGLLCNLDVYNAIFLISHIIVVYVDALDGPMKSCISAV